MELPSYTDNARQVNEQTRPLASSDGRRVLKEARSILELEDRLRLALDQQATIGKLLIKDD